MRAELIRKITSILKTQWELYGQTQDQQVMLCLLDKAFFLMTPYQSDQILTGQAATDYICKMLHKLQAIPNGFEVSFEIIPLTSTSCSCMAQLYFTQRLCEEEMTVQMRFSFSMRETSEGEWKFVQMHHSLPIHSQPDQNAAISPFDLSHELLLKTLVEEQAKRLVQVNQQALYQSRRDSLTGLFNRVSIEEEIDAYLLQPDSSGALMMLDLDNFKQVNDQFGHSAGDRLLKVFSQQLQALFRSDDLIGRTGGDEFVVFMRGKTTRELVVRKAEQILQMVRQRLEGAEEARDISVSIGVALAKNDGDTFETLWNNADVALYGVKGSGKNSYGFFDVALSPIPPLDLQDIDLQNAQIDLNNIQQHLEEQVKNKGAYSQDYESFRRIYRYVARGLSRAKQQNFIMLIAITDPLGSAPESEQFAQRVQYLEQAIARALRLGDVFTRYSASQFVLLLTGASCEHASIIEQRIYHYYHASNPPEDLQLRYHCQPIFPVEL